MRLFRYLLFLLVRLVMFVECSWNIGPKSDDASLANKSAGGSFVMMFAELTCGEEVRG